MASSSDSNEITPSSLVTWQTVFWTLVPLATNIMTQPSGRLCGISSRSRVYLRSSPIVCTADILSFVLQIAYIIAFCRITPLQATRLVIAERYKDVKDPSDDLAYFESQVWLRWLLFIFGALLPGIKLAAMQGVPWMKSWGMMFLVSFVVIEMINVLMWFQKHRTELGEGNIHITTEVAETTNWVLGMLALVSHAALIIWCLSDLFASDRSAKIATKAALGYGFTIYIVIVIFLNQRPDLSQNGRIHFQFYTFWVTFLGTGMSIISQTLIYDEAGEDDLYPIIVHDLICYVCLIITIFGYPLLLIIIISFIGRKFPSAGMKLLVVETETETETPSVKAEACQALAFFLVNITVFVTWYAFRFNPDGTVNPSWTGVFG